MDDGPAFHSITGASGGADEDTWMPLHWSAFVGDHETVIELLRQGASVSVRSSNGRTPLMLASLTGNDSVVSVLLSYMTKEDMDARDIEGRTALHQATANVHASIVELLIKRGAEMDTVDVHGIAPLITAILSSSRDLVRCFLNAGAKVNIANPKTSLVGLHTAAEEGFCDIMKLLLDHTDADVNVQGVYGLTPLHSAAYFNRTDAVKMLLQRGANIRVTTSDGYTAIICASEKNSIDSLFVLLNHDNSDIDAKCDFSYIDGASALAIAAYLGYSAVAEKLIAHGASVDANDAFGCTALHRAVVEQRLGGKKSRDNDHFKVAELLIKSGHANVNALNFSGDTPLHRVAFDNPGNLQIMQLLLDNGADINAQNSGGMTPLHCAIEQFGKSGLHMDAVDFLVQRGADLFRVDCEGMRSSIHLWKVLFSGLHLPPKLIARMGSRPFFDQSPSNVRESNLPIDYLDNTCLHYTVGCKALAACRSTRYMVDFRLRTGGDLTVQNMFGHTPLHVTTSANLKHILESETFRAEFFLVKDKNGRTPLHTYCNKHFNVTNKQSLLQLAKRIKPNDKIQLQDIVNNPDDFGCIPLHYAAEVGHFGKVRYFLEGGSDCNMRDMKGRIPLHYAKTRLVYNLLLDYTKNERIRDIDGLEPNEMMQMREIDGERARRMKNLRTERFGQLQKYFKEPVKLMLKGIFKNPQSISFLGQRMNVLHMFEPTFCAQEAVWKIWSEHDYAYRDVASHRIRQEVSHFIDRLIFAIGKQDPRFEGKPVLIGSAFEETKTQFPDEFDFDIVLTKFSKLCKVVESPVVPKGFVYLKTRRRFKDNKELLYERRESIEQDYFYDDKGGSSFNYWRYERFRERKTRIYARDEESDRKEKSINAFFDKDGFLKTYDVNREFHRNFQEVLSRTNFWENEPIFKLDVTEMLQFYLLVPETICRNLKLIVNKAIAGRHLFRKISVDVVPCFHIDGWWPEGAMQNVREAYKAEGCNLVIEWPQRKYPWIPFSISHTVRISFGPAESRMIKASQPIAKAAYMVAKHIVGESKQSYALKTALLYCIEAAGDTNHFYNTINARDLCSWVRMILLCFLHFSLEDHIPCYFMPTFHLPFIRSLQFDMCRQTLKGAHMRLFGAGCLNYRDVEKMARYEAEDETPVQRSVIHEIMRSYFVYWFTCDRLTDFEFRFPTPNPLSEEGLKREELVRTLRAALKN